MSGVFTKEQLATLVTPILRRYGAVGASLFGSYARGSAGPDSDIDLIVHGGSNFEPTNIFAFAEDLHELSGKNVDVFEESELDPSTDFYRQLKADLVTLV